MRADRGLVDGYLLFLERPLLGWVPGTSPSARMHLHAAGEFESPLQLHSLYGQLIAETGCGGTILFVWINWYLIASLLRIARRGLDLVTNMAAILLAGFAINILYGFVSHTLFGHNWIFLFGFSTVLISEQHIVDRVKDSGSIAAVTTEIQV